MSSAETLSEPAPKRRSRWPLLIGLTVAVLLGAGGFYATFTGLLLGPAPPEAVADQPDPLPDIAFVPVDPIVIALGPAGEGRHLRMTAQLEVGKSFAAEVALVLPRVLDVLNGYLRAVEVAELENPASLLRLRAQMLRRIQIVTGEGRVRDLLITEFVLN